MSFSEFNNRLVADRLALSTETSSKSTSTGCVAGQDTLTSYIALGERCANWYTRFCTKGLGQVEQIGASANKAVTGITVRSGVQQLRLSPTGLTSSYESADETRPKVKPSLVNKRPKTAGLLLTSK